MRPELIILHHSLTEDGKTVSWDNIRDYHVNTLKWNDIGYHFGIELADDSFEILMGRMPDQVGAHCREFRANYRSIGICFAGNFDKDFLPPGQLNKGLELVRFLIRHYGLSKEIVYGHRDFAPYKSCPGKNFDIKKFRELL